jgi:rhodanese-related sulfurtransferase
MQEITAFSLKAKIEAREDIQIIDIREDHEVAISSIGGTHIPMGEILSRTNELRTDCMVVIHCRSGKRSAAVIHLLEQRFELKNLYNLSGGILAWAESIDPKMEKY